ncbi:stemmadenine O-acetyltransferase-like [Cornus florida]|uniref:stemmadenine O-acetyltransferase-like n=1 Tax=Cornus florida TaxID=4283 RepID=UPI0028989C5C|nr:stemmadenine O-acetyltransferase-like [Cornus florida]
MGKVEITSRESIKPSSPTPQTLRNFKLSLLDAPNRDSKIKTIDTTNLLKKSLSETLTRFYPVAGRIKDNLLIGCSDEGADFLEAKVNCPLSEVLKQPEADVLNHFLPQDYHCCKSHMEVLLATQVNIFSCGGMAIGVCMSHKIFDGSTIGQFINGWAAMSRGLGETPQLTKSKCITKRFVFDASNIALLREKVAKHSCVDRPTRLEVTSALIWKCAMEVQRAKSGSFRPSFASQTVNLHPRMVPPMPEQSAGNLWWAISISCAGLDIKNLFILMDTPQRDGIEAWVTLDEQDMSIFECDHELLTYVSSQS